MKRRFCMERKTNNPSWYLERIQEKIEGYKERARKTINPEVKKQLEIIIDDLEDILYN